MAASKSIREKYYAKNKKFTRAVDELDIYRDQSIAQVNARRSIRTLQSNSKNAQQEELSPIKPKKLMIALTRLTANEIESALQGNLNLENKENKDVEKEQNTKKKVYNLRNRK